MNVVKIGAQFNSPNQMIEMTIHTKTDVALRTATTSWTTPRAVRETKAASASSSATTTAPPKPTRMRASEAPVCFQISPDLTISTKPRSTCDGDGSTYAPYRHD